MIKFVKKNILLSVALMGLGVQQLQAADLSIVIDDSAGMCGYLAAPTEQNTYKKSLIKLLQANDASSLNVNAYFLSDMSKPLAVGTAIDRVVKANATQCPFTAVQSPLHQGVDLKKIKSKSVILITDLLFDEGEQGGSNSRSAFVGAFDQLAQLGQSNTSQWFATNAGIMGLKSSFAGNYYSVHGTATQNFAKQPVERPFYVVWLSSDHRFSPYLNQMTYLWQTPTWSNKKYTIEGAFAVRLLPTTEIIAANEGLFSAEIKPSLLDKSKLGLPQILYTATNSKKLDDTMPVNNSGEFPIPNECFKTTSDPLHIEFKSDCAKGGSNEQALFAATKFPQALLINYPLSNKVNALNRSFEVISQSKGFNNPTEAFYRTTAASAFYTANLAKRRVANAVIHVKGLKGAVSFLSNSPRIQQKSLMLDITEKFSANPNTLPVIYKVAQTHWSSEQEPCIEKTAICQQAAKSTYLFENLLQSLATRLNAGQKTATLLNAQYPQPVTLTIEYK